MCLFSQIYQVQALQVLLLAELDVTKRSGSAVAPPHARAFIATVLGQSLQVNITLCVFALLQSFTSVQDVDNWPLDALKAYVADAVGARAISDFVDAAPFTQNAHTGVKPIDDTNDALTTANASQSFT